MFRFFISPWLLCALVIFSLGLGVVAAQEKSPLPPPRVVGEKKAKPDETPKPKEEPKAKEEPKKKDSGSTFEPVLPKGGEKKEDAKEEAKKE